MRAPSGEMANAPGPTDIGALGSVLMVKRATGRGGVRSRSASHVATAPAASATSAVAAMAIARETRARRGTGAGVSALASRIHRNCVATSCALCHRSSGSLARQVRITRSSESGASGCTVEIGGGSRSRIEAIRLARLFASKARLPVVISYSSEPRAKMSVRASASRPSICSGAMYWNVPTIAPSSVSGFACVIAAVSAFGSFAAGCANFARSKSSSFAPLFVSMTLPGVRSRWTMPARCARSSASAISTP